MHARAHPVHNRFQYPVYFYVFDVDELAELDRTIPLFGHNRLRPVAVHDRDYLLSGTEHLREKVEAILARGGNGQHPERIDLVTSARYLHYVFNPVSFFYCYGEDSDLMTVIVQVNNTFGEMHVYPLRETIGAKRGYLGHFRADKAFHVSPFFDRIGSYEFSLSDSRGEELDILIQYSQGQDLVFAARLRGTGQPLTAGSLTRTIARHPVMAALTTPRITRQAARLRFRKHLPVFRKPAPASPDTIRPAPPALLDRLGRKTLERLLGRLSRGRLSLVSPDGSVRTFGEPGTGREAFITVRDHSFYRRTLFSGDIGFGESFTAAEWVTDDLVQVLSLLAENLEDAGEQRHRLSALGRGAMFVQHLLRPNTVQGSCRNIGNHYDLSNDFFSAFLDPTMTYSCALFEGPDDTLETAQMNKIRSIIRRAGITADDHVLEIGCGWGSFAIEAARSTGCRVTGITISENQMALARERVDRAGLADRVSVELLDYRHITGVYDRVVSIEMAEAVGHGNLGRYFNVVDRALRPGGAALIQVITIPDHRYHRYRRSSDWIRKHIFPGGHLPSLEAMKEAMDRESGLELTEIEDIGPHYTRTLILWRTGLTGHADRIRDLGFDDSFIRKWQYYFAYCEAGFATGNLHNYQMVLNKPKPGDGP
jgi:cyclopropane-fatty-acyl-phospholipid synthase